MRVVAFWAAVAGVIAAGGHGALLVANLLGAEIAVLGIAGLAADVGLTAFTLLSGVFLLIVAVTGRKPD